ncbi:MAG: radical SAM protein [Nanoarchaeota archaeon]|nr:radical SAM protein [Nanoarchaeota archaeon]MBU0962497.1 radical SAM protein [Nanoarchaeota archaeon]
MIRIGNQKYTFKELWKVKKSMILAVSSPKKFINFLKIKYSEIKKTPKVYGLPYSIFIETSSYCNLRCPMCLKLQKNSKFDNRNIGLDEYNKLMKQIGPTMITLRLWNYGEPLINKDIFKMIKIAKKYKIFTVLSTNGVLMDKETSKKLLDSGLDFLVISFDGASKETYEKNRKNGTFEVVLKNVQDFMDLKNQMKRNNIIVSIQFIIMNTNEDEVDKIKEITNKLGADKLMLRVLNVVSEKGSELLPKNKKYENIEKEQIKNVNFCSNVWEETVINSTGAVTPCCMDAALEFPFGNAFSEDFRAIWNNTKYIEFRKKILENINQIKICNAYCYKKDNKLNFIK